MSTPGHDHEHLALTIVGAGADDQLYSRTWTIPKWWADQLAYALGTPQQSAIVPRDQVPLISKFATEHTITINHPSGGGSDGPV